MSGSCPGRGKRTMRRGMGVRTGISEKRRVRDIYKFTIINYSKLISHRQDFLLLNAFFSDLVLTQQSRHFAFFTMLILIFL